MALEPSIIQDSLQGGEGTPSPMLSVTGLSLKELEPHIMNTNKHLPAASQVHVSLGLCLHIRFASFHCLSTGLERPTSLKLLPMLSILVLEV